MKMLKNRLYQIEVDKQATKKAELDANKSDVSFGSQIRSYVFQPYTMVNDHRTELKIPDVQKVMDGDIDPFIEAYLKRARRRAQRERGVSDELNFVQRARREKLDALVARGRRAVRLRLRPDARRRGRGRRASGRRTRTGRDACASPDARGVARRTARRRSRTSPTTSGRIQLYFRKDELGDERFAQLDLLDIGDVVGVAGPLFRTRTGEVTVRVDDGRAAREVAAPAAVRQGRGRRRRDGPPLGLRRSGAALPAALRRSRRASRGARAVSSRARA